ncbi:hypothetical protein ACFP5Z_12255, partial [Kocuria oceani]
TRGRPARSRPLEEKPVSTIRRALTAHPAAPELPRQERSEDSECLEACVETAQVRLIAADACVEEEAVAELLARRS